MRADAMMTPGQSPERPRLRAALKRVAVTFRGMTAHPDESNCECHWGSAEELAQLKVPNVTLEPDLLHRAWQAADWDDHAAVLRRILPQLSTALVSGLVKPFSGMEEVGRSLDRGQWQQWPSMQAAAVREFLNAWWSHTLTDPDPAVPAHEVLALCAEASTALGPWLETWEAQRCAVADRHLIEAVTRWEYDLLGDQLPWESWENEEETCAELTAWLIRHAPDRLRAQNAHEELLHRVRLLGLAGPARWEDPHWPDYRY
ncbi:hypothetical protein [Planomonospora parontospora]|uniref:hypothetical protein n=1 Tax=Planomonospora parontospora TaxID=58119 RepID=UPI001E5C79E8|nr:hypothetical protein [Planomonospora parontospora]